MSLLATGITAAAGALGQGINAYSAGRMNKRGERFANRMYDQQRQHALDDWHMQNAYNDPAAQMQRLKGAGLNPNLVYGSGAAAQTAQSAPRSSSVSQPKYTTPQVDMGSIALQAMQMKQIEAGIARTEAETNAIKARTVGEEFKNQVNQAIGVENMRYRYNVELNKLSQEQKKDLMEFEAYITASGNTQSEASPRVQAIKASYDQAVQEASNAAALGDIRRYETVIKRFEADLTKKGISPNSPYYIKSIMSLVEATGIGKFFNDLPATYQEATR